MKIATHNSLSSYQPKCWWMKLINRWARCQNRTIEEQYEDGVRMFDIRVRPFSGKVAHGLVEYDVNLDEVLNYLNTQRKCNSNVYVRLCCETRIYEPMQDCVEWFEKYFDEVSDKYKHIKFCGGYVKTGWHKVIECKDPEYKELYHTLNGYHGEKGFVKKFLWILDSICYTPETFAKLDNARYYAENESYKHFVMLDFIEYGKYM